MTRLLTTGFESGDVNEAGVSAIPASTALTVVSSTPTPRAATYCLKCATTASTNNFTVSKTFTFAAAKTEVWARFAVYVHIAAGSTQTEFILGVALDSAGAAQTCITWNLTTGIVSLRLGASSTGTLLAASSLTFPADTWHTLEWRTQITSTTVGVSEVWLDGTRIINFSGDNTNTANANVQRLQVCLGGTGASSVLAGSYVAFDDIAVNDTAGSINNGQIGDGRVFLLKPNGAGSNTNQTRGGTDSGANWSQVDELPPSMTDYVFSASAATRDTYALEDVPAGSWTVNCVEVLAFAANSDAGAGSLGLTVKSGSTTNEGTAQNLSITAAYYRQLYETDPATSAVWTTTAVSALEAGTTVR